MFGWLLDTISSDGIPDGYARGLDIDSDFFIAGLIFGVVIMLCIIGIKKFAKWIIEDNKKNEESLSKKDDE